MGLSVCWKLPSAAFLLTPGCIALAFFQCAFRAYRCVFHSLFRLVLQHLCVGVADAGWAASPGSPFEWAAFYPACGEKAARDTVKNGPRSFSSVTTLLKTPQLQGILLIQGQDLMNFLYVSALMGLRNYLAFQNNCRKWMWCVFDKELTKCESYR